MPSVFHREADVRQVIEAAFPGLIGKKWRPKSPFDDAYKCIAWAAGDVTRHWWPVDFPPICYWPEGVPLEDTVNAFVLAFETLGYRSTPNRAFQFGFQKVAIYAKANARVKHMARQHILGRGWLSKLGALEDILHPDLESIEGDATNLLSDDYGIVVQIMERDWLTAARFGLFRCWWHAFQFWVYRIKGKLGFVKYTQTTP